MKGYFHRESSFSEKDEEFLCGICKRELKEPRLMPCLHTFCSDCILQLDSETLRGSNLRTFFAANQLKDNFKSKWVNKLLRQGKTGNLFVVSNSARKKRSLGHEPRSGNVTDKMKILKCPVCGFNNTLPKGGIGELPRNYLLQHRKLLAVLNKSDVRLLCDLCEIDIMAMSRCSKCLLNLCGNCSSAHKMQKGMTYHEILPLKMYHRSGTGITEVRRQAMCSLHPQDDIKFFCFSCNQTICKKCMLIQHRNHSLGVLSKAALMYRWKIKELLEQSFFVMKKAETIKINYESNFQEIMSNYASLKKEIDSYINGYVETLEQHRRGLKLEIEEVGRSEIKCLKQQFLQAEKAEMETNHALKFGEELLAEGSDFEIISLASPLLRRLEWIIQQGSIKPVEYKFDNLLQFLRDERAGIINNYHVFGVLTNQIISPKYSSITPEGLHALNNCKQKEKCQVTLVTRDCNNKPMKRGAENINMDLRYIENGQRQIPVLAVDQKDGTYLITFTSDVPGKLHLSITIRGHPIRGSPFIVNVRKHQFHKGVYHCCTFCSSNGNKKASCGCGGHMPGGYVGCGHGHIGHPGKNHWSCCGSTLPDSECLRQPTRVYHLTF